MYKLLASILLFPSIAIAEPFKVNKPVVCDAVRSVIETLAREFKETPFWVGDAKDTKFVVLRNEESNTWTIIQYNNETACILGEGEGFKVKK